MKKIIAGIAVFLLLLVAVLLLLPFVLDVNRFKPQIVAAAQEKLGRKVALGGPIELRLFPNVALKLEDVALGNPGWAGGGDMITAKRIALGVRLLPLLHKQVQVDSLEIEAPVVNLVKKGGMANWQFDDGKKAPALQTASPAQPVALGVQKLTLRNALLIYRDSGAGTTQILKDFNVTLAMPGDTLSLKGGGLYNGKPVKLALGLKPWRSLQDGTPADLAGDVAYGTLSAVFTGDLTLGKVPSLKGTLTADALDVNALLPPESGSAAGSGGAKPIVWSNDPITLSFLNSFDADLAVHIGSFTLKKMTIVPLDTTLKIKGGVLAFDIPQANAYGGRVSANIRATAANDVGFSTRLTGVQAEPLLAQWMNVDSLTGKLNAALNVTMSGKSQRAMIGALSGTGNFHFADGAIKGRNFAAIVRTVKARLSGGAAADMSAQQTDFSELGGTLTIKNGVVSNNDLLMKSPLLRLTGAGTINLPATHIDYRLKPEIVATLKGQGGKEASGLSIPILVSGPLNNPSIGLDAQAAIMDNLAPDKIGKTLENVKGLKLSKKNLLGKNGLGGLLGGR